jgi:branched-chain amino acid aminotransferase
VPFDELESFAEVAACGTAVVVTPVYEITRGDKVITISDPETSGPVLQKLYDTAQGIQYGVLPDKHGWCVDI